MKENTWEHEIATGKRFGFGANWIKYLSGFSEKRLRQAEQSICTNLGVATLEGKSFLDVGCGSGLFSLAAHNLGAKVISFDYDPNSVKCTRSLREIAKADEKHWAIRQLSVLAPADISQLGTFDVVYSWGVLHHTGDMWRALTNILPLPNDTGLLYVAIYNDQGLRSKLWRKVKRLYVALPDICKPVYAAIVAGVMTTRSFIISCLAGAPGVFLKQIVQYESTSGRGMSWWRDQVDWIGGYPFEVAKPEQIFDLLKLHGFELERLKTCGGGLGCNEYVFKRVRRFSQTGGTTPVPTDASLSCNAAA